MLITMYWLQTLIAECAICCLWYKHCYKAGCVVGISWCLPPAQPCCETWISLSHLEVLEGICAISPGSLGVVQHSEPAKKPLCLTLKAAERVLKSSWVTGTKFNLAFLAGFTFSHELYNIDIPIYVWRTTKLCICKQVYSFPVSITYVKRENPIVYCANFTQCICTGHCKSGIYSPALLICDPICENPA